MPATHWFSLETSRRQSDAHPFLPNASRQRASVAREGLACAFKSAAPLSEPTLSTSFRVGDLAHPRTPALMRARGLALVQVLCHD